MCTTAVPRKPGDACGALVRLRRPDGSSIGFARNACVLVNAKGAPLGTRVLGFAAHELRARGLLKVLSLTARVL